MGPAAMFESQQYRNGVAVIAKRRTCGVIWAGRACAVATDNSAGFPAGRETAGLERQSACHAHRISYKAKIGPAFGAEAIGLIDDFPATGAARRQHQVKRRGTKPGGERGKVHSFDCCPLYPTKKVRLAYMPAE